MQVVSRASIATTANNTAVAFTLLGLVTTVVFLMTNAIFVFMTLKDIKPPDIKQIVIKGLENGPVELFLDLEFPGTARGNLISAQTEGPLKVSVFITEKGKKPAEKPSLSAEILSGINLNLASNVPTRLIIDDLKIKLDESFESSILSKLVKAKMDDTFKPEMLPNFSIRIDTRVVFKSLWIPLGASVNMPIELDLADMMKKSAEKAKRDEAAKGKKEEPVISAREIEKQKAIKDFDFKPRLVQVAASNSDKLEIHAVAAIPAAYVPDFLTVEIPELKFQANFYELEAEENNIPVRFVQFGVEQFVLEPAPAGNLNAEINFKAKLKINKTDVDGVKKILELAREEKKYKIGVQIKPSEEFIMTKKAGGLLHWLRDFVLDVPVGELLKKMDETNKLKEVEVTKPNEEIVTESDEKILKAETLKENKQKTIVSAKFLRAEKTLQGGKFIFQFKILHSAVDFLIGSLPVIDFQTVLDDGTKLLGIQIYSNEIAKESPTIEINIALEINNLRQAVYTGLLFSKMGTEEMHKKIPEIRAIKGLKVEFISENIISKIASALNLNVSFGENGIEAVKFQNSDYIIFPKPEKVEPAKTVVRNINEEEVKQVTSTISTGASAEDKPKIDQSSKTNEKSKKYKNLEFFTKFAIENDGEQEGDDKTVHIGASIDLDEVPYSGDVGYVSWKHFDLAVNYKMETLLIFKIYRGAAKVGFTGGFKPLFASFATGILVPSNDKHLVNMTNFLKSVMYSKDEILNLDFEIKYGKSKSDQKDANEPIIFNANFPCKNLLLAKPNKVEDKKTESVKDETTKDTNEQVKSDSKEDERSDFIGKVKNPIISFVSFHATTLFFHITYPNGYYCKPDLSSNFDLKINFDVILPMIEANVCAKDDIDAELKCFASAGLSRPMKLSTKIIDGQVCKVESLILPQEPALYNDPTFKALNSYNYENNEIPAHLSIKNLADLVRFVDMVGDKRKQFLTVGPVDTATNVNKFIGVVISSVFELEFKSDIAENVLKPIVVFYRPESTALIDIRASSATLNEVQLLVNFKLPENSLFGIQTATAKENRIQWPAIRWGTFEYSFGVKKLFKLSLAVNRGQVDIHEDGIVMSALNDFSLRIKLKTDESVNLGSTNLRLILGSIKGYLYPDSEESKYSDSNFINDLNDHTFAYKFTMENPRELNEGIKFFSNGDVKVKEILDVINAIISRDNLSDKPKKKEQKVVLQDPSDQNPFKDLRVTIKTVDQERKSIFELPCLIPALCKKDSLLVQERYDIRNDGEPMRLVFELENLLTPAIELIGSKLGPVLRNFKMADYPSNLKFSIALLSDVWVTMVLDGAGLASVGLSKKTTMFSRSVIIDYGPDVTSFTPNERVNLVDKLELPLLFRFPKTIIGLRKTMAAFRREAFLIPPVAPLYYTGIYTGAIQRVSLTNPPLMISLSSDDRYPPGIDQNNLLSAVIAAGLPEMNVGSINADFLLDMLYGPYVRPQDTNNTADVKKQTPSANPVVIEEKGTNTEMGKLGYGEMASLASCVVLSKIGTSSMCSQLDFNYNMKVQFPVDILKMILPNTAIFRLSVDRSPFFQYVIDSRKQKSFEVSSETGLDMMGTVSIHLGGLPQPVKQSSKTVADVIRNENGEHEFKLNVIVGHDIDFKSSLYFPIDLIKAHLSSKVKGILPSFSSYLYGKTDTTKEFQSLIVKPVVELVTISSNALLEFRPEMRECIDNNPEIDKLQRLKEIDYSKSAIYFEQGNEVLYVNRKSKFYLQLRTTNEQVVCGLPIIAKDLEIEFVRDEKEQGFVKLVDFLSFKAPPAHLVEKGTVTFNHAFNLFVVEATLPYPGRYTVIVKNVQNFTSRSKEYVDGTTELKNSFLYVKNNY